MLAFLAQPEAYRTGSEISDELSAAWERLDMAVAWVRESGVRIIEDPFRRFLGAGGSATVVAGLDYRHTTQEGLQALLDLKSSGRIDVFVWHDEGRPVFHPKVFLFSNPERGRLLLGSSNLTDGGLYTNHEAMIRVEAPIGEPIIADAMRALAGWRDTSLGFSLPLTAALLADLVTEGYVPDERLARKLQGAAAKTSPAARANRFRATFPSPATVARPPRTVRPTPSVAPAAVGQVLIMRPRFHRGDTQMQIPLELFRDPFLSGVVSVRSWHDGAIHPLVISHSVRGGGTPNTVKLEIPEARGNANPVLRLEWTATGIEYMLYDGNQPMGQLLLSILMMGLTQSPTTTLQSIPDTAHATLWTFI